MKGTLPFVGPDATTLYIVSAPLPDGRWRSTAYRSEEDARAEVSRYQGASIEVWLYDEVKRQVHVPETV